MHSMFCLLLDSAEQIREEIGIKLHLLSRFENLSTNLIEAAR